MKNEINENKALSQTSVSGSVSSLTENRFRQLFSDLGNCSERYENENKVIVYTLNRNIDNKFNLSYHLKFPQKNIQFNFWFDKISYLNSKGSVSISFFNGNEPKEKDRLKHILTTNYINELKKKVDELFIQHTQFQRYRFTLPLIFKSTK